MADMTTIKGRIAETIYPNGKGTITAESHQALLLEMVDDINAKKADKEEVTFLDKKVTILANETGSSVQNLQDELTELSSYVGENDVNDSLSSGFNFFDIDIVAGREYYITNNGSSRITVYTSNEKKSDWNYVEELSGINGGVSVSVKPTLSAKVLKVYASAEISGFVFKIKQGNACLKEQVDLLEQTIEETDVKIEDAKTEISENASRISAIENTIGEQVDLNSAERIVAFIEQFQSDMYWQSKSNTSAVVIPVNKGDKYTIVAGGVKSYYALTDKLDYNENYKEISLIDSIGGAINANTTIEVVCPSDAYLIVSEIDNKGTNRIPSAISKYLGNIKTAIDDGLKELSSKIDTKIEQNNANVQQSLDGLSAEIAKKITNPSIGANGAVLMSLGNGEVKWANVLPKSGVFYGYFATSAELPSANEIGYAYVGEKAPFTIYNYNGGTWQNSGITTYEEDYKRINVRDFGAVGDGVTNDENAIASAFAYAVANLPCEVYFPKGDYGILNGGFPVKIPNGTGGLRIMGDGGNLSRIVYLPEFEMTTGEGWYAIRVQPTTTPTNEDGYIHDISIVNMGVYDTDPYNHALNPDATDGLKEETHGFDIQYAIRARVEGCFIDSVGDECIDIYSCIDTIVVNNITHNSPAAGNAGGAISIGDGSHNVIVANNIVRGNIATKHNFGIAIESLKIPVSKVVISNNTISSLSGTGVKLSTPNQGAGITDVDIIGNVVNGCTYGIGDEGIYEKKNITIVSNVLTNIAHTAIYLSKQGSNILIDGCVIDSCQYAMWLNPLISISNCTITNIYGYVAMVSSDEVIFDNCKIDNVCQDTTSWVIYIYGDEPIVSVRNCSITNIHSSRGLQKMKNVVNTDIYFTDSGDAVSGVAITEKVVGVSTNGRISIGKNYAMVRDVSIVSENIGSNAITIAANVIGASVLGCYVNINNYSAIKENSGCDKNLFCNNITNQSIVIVGENSLAETNIKL